jgi:hypothetical protein
MFFLLGYCKHSRGVFQEAFSSQRMHFTLDSGLVFIKFISFRAVESGDTKAEAAD